MPEEKEEAKEEQPNDNESEEEVPTKFLSFRDFFLNREDSWINSLITKRRKYELSRTD